MVEEFPVFRKAGDIPKILPNPRVVGCQVENGQQLDSQLKNKHFSVFGGLVCLERKEAHYAPIRGNVLYSAISTRTRRKRAGSLGALMECCIVTLLQS